ncbi:MAG: ATP-binding protein [Bdellovibrionota bacterium]
MWQRDLANRLDKALKNFSAIVLTGPRRAGKTFLLKSLRPKAQYVLLEDPDIITRAKSDPRAFLESLRFPVILDEIQNCPELLPYIRTIIDSKNKKGQWLITGSQEFSIMKGVTESMTGRAAIFQLLPLSYHETKQTSPLIGGFPEILKRKALKNDWFRSYLQTYIERDIREIINVKDMSSYRLFIQLLAQRNGQVLNKSDLAAPVGVKVPTIAHWLSALEITNQIYFVRPYFNNYEKRLIKSPKIYFLDSGLLCHILNIQTEADLVRHPYAGFVFEAYVLSELLKSQINKGAAKEVYYFRDESGLEIDFMVPRKNNHLELIEVKYTKTPLPAMVQNLISLNKKIKDKTTILSLIHNANSVDNEILTQNVTAYNHKTYFSID